MRQWLFSPHLHNAYTWKNVLDKLLYILVINKTVKQQKLKFKHSLNTLNHENTTQCAQNVHRELWHKQRDGDATGWWLQQQSNGPTFSIWLTFSFLVLQDATKTSALATHNIRHTWWANLWFGDPLGEPPQMGENMPGTNVGLPSCTILCRSVPPSPRTKIYVTNNRTESKLMPSILPY